MRAGWLIAGALGFMAANGLISLIVSPFPSPLDELHHVSYVRWMEAHPALFPRYETMRRLTPDLTRWNSQLISTAHPSLYYLTLAGVDRVLRSVIALRLANLALALFGIGLVLAAGFRIVTDEGQRTFFALLAVLFPKSGIVAGIVNNDNLGLVATGLGFLALVRWRENPGGWLIAGALALAGWTKLTVLLMLGLGFVFMELLAGLAPLRRYLPVMVGAAIGALPSLVNLARYGSPVFDSPAPAMTHYGRLGIASFLSSRTRLFAESWSALEPSNPLAVLGLILVLTVGACACVVLWRRSPIATGLMLAFAPVVALQFWFLWRTAHRDGFLDQAASRYYYAVWPGFALGAAQIWTPQIWRVAVGAALLMCLFASSAIFCIGLVVLTGRSLT